MRRHWEGRFLFVVQFGFILIGCIAVSQLLISCNTRTIDSSPYSTSSSQTLTNDWITNQFKWKMAGVRDYTFSIKRECENGVRCRPQQLKSKGEMDQHDNGEEHRFDGTSWKPIDNYTPRSIEGVFSDLRQSIDKGIVVSVEYDEQYGFPKRILIDDSKTGGIGRQIISTKEFSTKKVAPRNRAVSLEGLLQTIDTGKSDGTKQNVWLFDTNGNWNELRIAPGSSLTPTQFEAGTRATIDGNRSPGGIMGNGLIDVSQIKPINPAARTTLTGYISSFSGDIIESGVLYGLFILVGDDGSKSQLRASGELYQSLVAAIGQSVQVNGTLIPLNTSNLTTYLVNQIVVNGAASVSLNGLIIKFVNVNLDASFWMADDANDWYELITPTELQSTIVDFATRQARAFIKGLLSIDPTGRRSLQIQTLTELRNAIAETVVQGTIYRMNPIGTPLASDGTFHFGLKSDSGESFDLFIHNSVLANGDMLNEGYTVRATGVRSDQPNPTLFVNDIFVTDIQSDERILIGTLFENQNNIQPHRYGVRLNAGYSQTLFIDDVALNDQARANIGKLVRVDGVNFSEPTSPSTASSGLKVMRVVELGPDNQMAQSGVIERFSGTFGRARIKSGTANFATDFILLPGAINDYLALTIGAAVQLIGRIEPVSGLMLVSSVRKVFPTLNVMLNGTIDTIPMPSTFPIFYYPRSNVSGLMADNGKSIELDFSTTKFSLPLEYGTRVRVVGTSPTFVDKLNVESIKLIANVSNLVVIATIENYDIETGKGIAIASNGNKLTIFCVSYRSIGIDPIEPRSLKVGDMVEMIGKFDANINTFFVLKINPVPVTTRAVKRGSVIALTN